MSQFAERSTAAYTQVVVSRPLVLQKVLEQGYNAAWSDSDIAWLENPFTMFDKAADLVLTWADNSEISEALVFQHGKFAGKLLQLNEHHQGMAIIREIDSQHFILDLQL